MDSNLGVSDDDQNGVQDRAATIRAILNVMMEVRRRHPGEPLPEDLNELLAELVGDGTVLMQGLDEDDDDDDEYRPGQDDDEDMDENMDVDELDEDEDDEDDEDMYGYITGPAVRGTWHEEVKEPKEAGLSLLFSGEFGRIRHQIKTRNKDGSAAKFWLNSRSQLRPTSREDAACNVIPNSDGTAVASYFANAYVGQFSSDSTFYYTCVRDFRLHVYDTTAPIVPTTPVLRTSRARNQLLEQDHDTSMKVLKTIRAHPGGWTITDSHLSPDNTRMIYASVSSIVYMASTLDSNPTQVPINFADPPRTAGYYGNDSDGIWSCKFSADGNEVIAGGTEQVFVYDLVKDMRTVKIKAHEDDINSCCWADTASGNILVSASDDTFLKVWDRRSLGEQKPSGILIGHTEGITYVSAKGDGRYVISNGKDQVLRLWDLRKMRNNIEFESVKDKRYGIPNFDYRRGVYSRPRVKAHPLDCSVMQYTGHDVLRTLIRCHFSPAETTGGQYIYSGSADGRIHIWSLDGRVVQVLDRSNTLPMSFHPSDAQLPQTKSIQRKVCVRDVSWHSQQPVLMSAGWLGAGWTANEASVIARHEWKGLLKMQYKLEDYVQQQAAEKAERARRARSRPEVLVMPGAYRIETDDDE